MSVTLERSPSETAGAVFIACYTQSWSELHLSSLASIQEHDVRVDVYQQEVEVGIKQPLEAPKIRERHFPTITLTIGQLNIPVGDPSMTWPT